MTTQSSPELEVPATGKLSDYSGSKSPAFTNSLLNAVISTAWLPNGADRDAKTRQAHITLEVLRGFKPADEIEGMIAAQAVAMHQGAMECFRRAMIPDQPFDTAARLRKDGANLARGMTDMLAALDRKRGKGPQVVRVERVTVHQGGQAIVGTVQTGSAAAAGVTASPPPALEQDLTLDGFASPPPVLAKAARHREGAGHDGNLEAEPHEPAVDSVARLARDASAGAIGTALRRTESGWDTLPVPSDEQWALPAAWRPEHGPDLGGRTGAAGGGSDCAWRLWGRDAGVPHKDTEAAGGCTATTNRKVLTGRSSMQAPSRRRPTLFRGFVRHGHLMLKRSQHTKRYVALVATAIPERACNKPVVFWWLDKPRVDQQGILTRVWPDKGSRPPARRDQRCTEG